MHEFAENAADRPRWKTPQLSLVMLFLVSTVNYADRAVMAVLQEPMKHDLGLSDAQLGMLSGPIFAVFYAFVGIPVARLAERSSRRLIVVTALGIWSAITAMCGAAQNFVQIALFRVGVGAAEAGSPPASHSLIADYFPANKRGRAMSLIQMGVPVGSMLGSLTAGFVAHSHGWRIAFIVVGLPGLALAALAAWMLYEPKRGGHTHAAESVEKLTAFQALGILLRNKTFCLLLAAGALGGNAAHGINAFSASYFMRQYGLTLQQVGGLLATGKGVTGVLGALVGGYLADRFARKHMRSYALVPGFGSIVGAVFFFAAYQASTLMVALSTILVGYFFMNMLPSPTYAAIQNMVDNRMRATAAALYMFFVTVVGSLAPPIVGFVSDRVAKTAFPQSLGAYAIACPGGRPVAERAAEIGAACVQASAEGLRSGLVVPVAMLAATLFVYLLAARRMGEARG